MFSVNNGQKVQRFKYAQAPAQAPQAHTQRHVLSNINASEAVSGWRSCKGNNTNSEVPGFGNLKAPSPQWKSGQNFCYNNSNFPEQNNRERVYKPSKVSNVNILIALPYSSLHCSKYALCFTYVAMQIKNHASTHRKRRSMQGRLEWIRPSRLTPQKRAQKAAWGVRGINTPWI